MNGETVRVLTPARVFDPLAGWEVVDWSSVTPRDVTGVLFAQDSTADATPPDMGHPAAAATIYLPGREDPLTTDDRISARGCLWAVDGLPTQWRGPGTGGTVAKLRFLRTATEEDQNVW